MNKSVTPDDVSQVEPWIGDLDENEATIGHIAAFGARAVYGINARNMQKRSCRFANVNS